jgi:hypothetical protein
MARFHLVRVGALGHVGRFAAVDARRFPRGVRVIVRTGRGLEVGEILAPPADDLPAELSDGSILRPMTAEDDLLQSRLDRNRESAIAACGARITELGLPAVLMEAEHLFDGRTLVFYFLGEPSAPLDAVVAELAEVYEAKAQVRRFADTLEYGCGPACGTTEAEGAGCGACDTGCAVASACATRRPVPSDSPPSPARAQKSV